MSNVVLIDQQDGSRSSSTPSPSRPPSSSKSKRKSHPTFHFVAGLSSGLSSAILLQPVDLLKTRVQQSRSHRLLPVLRSILSSPHPITGLWRGTVPSALRTGFGSALYFTSLNSLRQLIANNQHILNPAINSISSKTSDGPLRRTSSVLPKLSNLQNLVTGATARVLAGLVLMPVTVIKVRYESDLYSYKSLLSASRDIFRREGIRGFFTGFGATAIRDAPYAGLYVLFYEASKSRLNRSRFATQENSAANKGTSSSTGATINASSGVFAAALATAITNPFDAVKTRLQLMPAKYGNTFRAAGLMLREDGVKAFFDGLGLRIARKSISSALAWTVYEELIGRAERRFIKDEEDGQRGVAAV